MALVACGGAASSWWEARSRVTRSSSTILARGRAETWLYDVERDAWSLAGGATLPFGSGMNYNLYYDSLHDILLLVTDAPDKPTSVWALKLR